MTIENQIQDDEEFDYGCECAMSLLNNPTEENLNNVIDDLDDEGVISTEIVYGLLATILMSLTSESPEEH